MNIAHNLERSQHLFPHKASLIFEGNSFTYQELNTLSNQIANVLAQLGVSRGDRVVLFLPNIPAFISSYFAIQKLGAVAVTLNSNFKAQETSFILSDCKAKIVITTTALRNQLQTENLPFIKQIVIAEGDAAGQDLLLTDLVAQSSPFAQVIELENDEPAVIIYTSGTTGFPKGVTLSQGNIIATVQTTTETLCLNSDDKVLLCLPAFHNYGQYATFNPCVNAAATLVLHREFELETVLRSIEKNAVTYFFGVPTLYTLLYENASVTQLASLKRCISAGAPLSVEMFHKWQDKFDLAINQIYGLTECSMVCFNHVSRCKVGSLGSPVKGTELKIVDDLGQSVLTGELGEIIVSSPSVMLGYLNLPEETTTAIKDGWFYTGDIGRFDEEGYVYLIDRSKDMINVGGEKVYPAEVEQVLSQHPAVAEVAVYGVPESLMGEQVFANVIVKAGQEVASKTLIDFCQKALANHKVPSVIQFVESLPKNKTGKVLKRLLREQAASIATEVQALKTPDELRIWLTNWLQKNLELKKPCEFNQSFSDYGLTSLLSVTLVLELNAWLGTSFDATLIWNYSTIDKLVAYLTHTQNLRHQWLQTAVNEREDLLKHHLRREIASMIGAKPTNSQSFFDLGMDSLLSIELSTRLSSSLELSLPATLALEYRTLDDLTRYLTGILNQLEESFVASDYDEKHIQPRPNNQNILLSFVQQKVWTRQQTNLEANLYNISRGIQLTGEINLEWLEQSLQMIGQRHEILRTTYYLNNGVVEPKVRAIAASNMTLVDMSHLSKAVQHNEIEALTFKVTQGSFDLSKQTWRVVLIKLTEDKHLFVICMHHLVMDAWSLALFFNELVVNYTALSEGKISPLPALKIQYADFAYWQKHYFTAERLASRLTYWQERLARKTPLLELPTDKPRPTSGQFFPSNTEWFCLSPELSKQVKSLSSGTGRTLYVTLLSAYMTLLNQRTDCEEIVVISPINKRDSQALEPLIGHFSEMGVLFIDLHGNPTFETLQERVYQMLLEAINQQDVPLEQVVESLLSGDNLIKDLPYRVSFNIIPSPDTVFDLPHVQTEAIVLDEAEQVKMIVDLALVLWENTESDASNLKGFLRYRTDLFEAKTIHKIIIDFENLLIQLVTRQIS